MLLDRRRIRRWGRWVALSLAVVFAVSFIALGVGASGQNLLAGLSCSGDSTVTTLSDQQRLNNDLAALQKNPKDVTTLLAIATIYERNNDLTDAASYLEKVIAIDPSQKAVYLRLAGLYLNDNVKNYQAAVKVLNKATAVDPTNPQVFLDLGSALNDLNQTGPAILAWQRYIQLDPNGDQVSVVKDKIKSLESTTTTTGATTTTTAAGATTTTK